MVCPNHTKVFYFSNNKSTRKNCSKYKPPFKSISWSGSGRILSGTSTYNSDGSIFYLFIFSPFESWLHRTSIFPHKPMLYEAYVKSKLYSSKYFIQYNPEVKNNLHPLFLQESPVKDGLLLFKYLKLNYRDTKPNSWLPTSSHAPLFLCKRPSWFLSN